jgi:4-alpha-glucanotransferase
VRGWFEHDAGQQDKARVFRYLGRKIPADEIHLEFVRLAMESPAQIALFPMQDILGLDQDARMNTPATLNGNWAWRLLPEQISPDATGILLEMTRASGRT